MPRGGAPLGHALGMVPRIDPALPLVWRTPTDLQLGATGTRVVLHDAGDVETGLIAALRHGASVETLTTIGLGLGGRPEQVRRLLGELAPLFEAAPPQATRRGTVAVDAAGDLGARVAADLAALGYEVLDLRDDSADGPAIEDLVDGVDLAVLGADWVVPPARHLRWLRRDVPHLAVVSDDSGFRVGPLVEPGTGPCLRCLELARRDADAAWPVIAAQLSGRRPATRDLRAVVEAGAVAVAAVDDRLAHRAGTLANVSIRLGRARPGGLPRPIRHEPHPECGCRAPGGIATAAAPLGGRRSPAPSSATAGAVPA